MDRPGDRHLARSGKLADSGADVDGDAGDIVVDPFDFAGVSSCVPEERSWTRLGGERTGGRRGWSASSGFASPAGLICVVGFDTTRRLVP